jgi:hypothetical protein
MRQQTFDVGTIGQIAQAMIYTARSMEFAVGVAALAAALGAPVQLPERPAAMPAVVIDAPDQEVTR